MGQNSLKMVVTNSGSLSSCLDLPSKLQTLFCSLSHRTQELLNTISEMWSSPFWAKGVLSLTVPPEKGGCNESWLTRRGTASCLGLVLIRCVSSFAVHVWCGVYTVHRLAMTCHSLQCRSNGWMVWSRLMPPCSLKGRVSKTRGQKCLKLSLSHQSAGG